MKHLVLLALLVSLCGCSTIVKLGPVGPGSANKVTLVDSRPADQKVSSRASTFSALRYYGDDEFQPPALSVFKSALASKVSSPVRVEVLEFRVADFFPHRLGIGVSGPIAALLEKAAGYSKQDLGAISSLNVPSDTDGVICLASVEVNGTTFHAGTFEPYSLGAAPMVASSSGFRHAARKAIEQAASDIVAQLAAKR